MSQGRFIVLTDLDDTLFASERSLPKGTALTHLAAMDAQQQPLSYQTPAQKRLWTLLERADLVVPVTGRTSYAIDRVTLPLSHPYRIASHGALVLVDGEVAPAWLASIEPEIAAARDALATAGGALEQLLTNEPGDIQTRLLDDMGVPVYLSLKADAPLSREALVTCSAVARRYGLALHANERNAALRPAYTSKARAARFVLDHLIQRQPEDMVMTLGDSLSDIGFMGAGDFAVAPTKSQLWTHTQELSQ